jgi:hypothetical protein
VKACPVTLVSRFRSNLGNSKYSISLLAAGFLALVSLLSTPAALAGGPKYVAGVSYFNPGVKGQPVRWTAGKVVYFVDRGSLGSLSNTQAVTMVDAAAAIWSAVPTAAVKLTDGGTLAEDVNGSNVVAGNSGPSPVANPIFAQPSDLAPSATTTPVGVVFDADGSVIDALEGAGASQPDNCSQNGVLVWIDAMNPDATLAHGVIVLNGRCTTSANLLAMMSYQLERTFGRILGLDFSQVNDAALAQDSTEPGGTLGWPIMDPLSGTCGPAGGTCIPNPTVLRFDDIAALNRMYPVTTANQSSFPGKLLTAANTVSLQGTITFRSGTGMQGVNVVARPLDSNGNPLYQYTVTFVSGGYFAGNHGNPVTGWTDKLGNRLDRFGSDSPALQGYFDLSGIPLPPGVTMANYQVSFEAVNPLYFGSISVGPYLLGSPAPSGAMQTVQVNGLQAGSAQTITANITNSAGGLAVRSTAVAVNPVMNPVMNPAAVMNPVTGRLGGITGGPIQIGRTGVGNTEIQPQPLPVTGMWSNRLGEVGASDWFIFAARGNRVFTIVAQALDETGKPSAAKAMPAIGVWDGFNQTGTTAVGFGPAQNGFATGETWLQVATGGNDIVRLGIADQRGDGRPDYLYRGWVLYADSVAPAHLPATGGVIVIRGIGFRAGDTVTVGGVAAQVTSILPTEITAIVPTNSAAVTGSLDVQVSDQPLYNAIAVIPGGVSYDAGDNDALNLVTAPANQVPMNVPQPFTVLAEVANGNPAGGVTVTYSVTSGTATLGCGQSGPSATCAVTATGDGRATMAVTATSSSIAVVTAALTNGSSVQAHFYGGTPAAMTALTPTLYLAAGATVQWPVQALAQSGSTPLAGQSVIWKNATGIAAPASPATTNSAGIATATLAVGSLAEGQTATTNACLNGGSTCVAFNAFGARPEFASLTPVSGTSQSMAAGVPPTSRSARPGYERPSHGRRHSDCKPIPLRLDAALPRAWPLRAGATAGRPDHHPYLRTGREHNPDTADDRRRRH